MRISLAILAALAAAACMTLRERVNGELRSPGLEGVRWGLIVLDGATGRELVSIRPDERFTPASNTKLFTIAAALQRMPNVGQPDPAAGASVRLEPREGGAPDIVLVGGGDAMLIDADDCERDCLSSLVDMATANGVTRVRDVIGDDQLFPDQRWADGWSHEDLIYRSGAPASALVVNSNEVVLQIAPGQKLGDPVQAAWREGDEYFQLLNEAVTAEGQKDALRIERMPGADTVRLYGTLGADVRPQTIPMAVEDPALAAAWRFRRALKKRGIDVEGEIRARHRLASLADEPETRGESAPSPAPKGVEIGRLVPPPLIEDIRFLSKQSQNMHAEVLLRRLGLIEGGGSIRDGLAIVEQMLTEFGADRASWSLSDGSGMSVYNRVTPRMVARFLFEASKTPWGPAFRESLAVGGVDGTLARRFRGTPLESRIFAKSGTLFGVNALSGFMHAKSGRLLVFSAFANDRPLQAGSATVAMDAALLIIAAAN
jgi:D-alanyl-D-alanine carboxypeptidase/D-alanyl-D-alanine-endopeptidase (penicillin-binding protein 4)